MLVFKGAVRNANYTWKVCLDTNETSRTLVPILSQCTVLFLPLLM